MNEATPDRVTEERMNACLDALTDATRALTEAGKQAERLKFAVEKLSKWSGVEIGELIEEGYLNEGDMD